MKALYLSILLLGCSLMGTAQPLQRVAPEQVGLSSRHLLYADSAIYRAIADEGIPGAVLAVVRQGKMAYLKAYGNRSVQPKTEAMTTNTVFDMASCSKPVGTAISAMILAERGLLRMTDPVSRYLPDFKPRKSADGKHTYIVTVQDLMTHTSGLPPYVNVAKMQEQHGTPCPDALRAYLDTCALDFAPKTDFQYSCLNFVTLQNIIQAVTGQSLRDFARENIFAPLGMAHTDYLPCHLDSKGRWVNDDDEAYIRQKFYQDGENLIAPTEQQPNGQMLRGQVHDPLARVLNGGISGNAGLYSSADDLGVLCAALQNGGEWNGVRILSPLTVKAMRTVPRQVREIGRTLGWDSYTAYASNNGDLLSEHTYSHTGYTGTSIVIDPDNDLSIILLINAVHPQDKHSVVRLRSLVANAVAGSLMPAPRTYTAHYYKRFLQFMEEAPITEKDLVMVGNSLTENGGDWGKRLGMKNVRNRGIIGDEVMGIYDRLHQILPGHPARLCLMSGVNDVSHHLSPDSIVGMIRQTLERIRCESPETRIYLQSLLPINESFNRYKRLEGRAPHIPVINEKLRRLAAEMQIEYIDLYPLFTAEDGLTLRSDLTTDGLHLNERGYDIWVKKLKEVL